MIGSLTMEKEQCKHYFFFQLDRAVHLQGKEVEDDASLIYLEQTNEGIRAVTGSETTHLV